MNGRGRDRMSDVNSQGDFKVVRDRPDNVHMIKKQATRRKIRDGCYNGQEKTSARIARAGVKNATKL